MAEIKNAQESINALMALTDEQLEKIQFTLPSIMLTPGAVDADGFPITHHKEKEDANITRGVLQGECWKKFVKNPQINTSVRGIVGRITGMGFESTSIIPEIQDAIEEIELDWRNRLYENWRQYVGRAMIEGELFLSLSCHSDGFIEVDFNDPSLLATAGDDDTGIIFHPRKKMLPLLYIFSSGDNAADRDIVPSVYVARDPSLLDAVKDHKDYNTDQMSQSKNSESAFQDLGGFNRFIVSWNKGFVTRRTISHLRTTIEWLNYYEDLKKYEIDHKKSAGAFVWAFKFEDVKAFRLWANLTAAERAATAITQPLGPGSKIFIPPGMTLTAVNPNLPNISNQDTDIMQMAISGLNEPSDVTTGSLTGTYASAKASRGPMSDRTSDEIAYFDRFYRFDFWGSIFWIKSKISGFPEFFDVDEVVGFGENGKEIMGKKRYQPSQLIETSYPISQTIDFQDLVKGLLGSKHGPLPESIGVPPSMINRILGIGSYGRNRLRKATEDKRFPPLVYSIDSNAIEAKQEQEEGPESSDGDKKVKAKTKAEPRDIQKNKNRNK